MAAPSLTLTADERAAVGTIVTRFPGLASAVHAQVTRLVDELVAADGTITRPAQVDEHLLKIVNQVLARPKTRGQSASREPGESVDSMVSLLARNSVARARPRLLEGLTARPEPKKSSARKGAAKVKARRRRGVHCPAGVFRDPPQNLANADVRDDRQPGPEREGWIGGLVEEDLHRHALDHLHEIAGRVLRGQQAEAGAGARLDAVHVAREPLTAIGVDPDLHGL